MTVCEIKQDESWRLIAIREALNVLDEPVFRCMECRGPVRLVSTGGSRVAAYFRHVKRHDGCSKMGSIFSGERRPHYDALS